MPPVPQPTPGVIAPSVQTHAVVPPPSHSIPSSAIGTGAATSSSSFIDRSRKFVEEHKLLVLGAAVLAVSGAGYYLYSTRPPASGPSSGGGGGASIDDVNPSSTSSTSASKKKKKAKSKKSKLGGSGDQGPLLEERDPAEVARLLEKREKEKNQAQQPVEQEKPAVGGESGLKSGFLSEKKESSPAPESSAPATQASYLEGVPTGDELAALSAQERKTLATTLKNRGNKLYSAKDYASAIACYTRALEVADKEEAVFYSNRAACYQNKSPPDYEQVVRDCDAALRLDAQYVKALNRRASALEALGRDEEALRDFTATTIMERFQNDSAATAVDRVLKKVATKKAEEMLRSREPKLPSNTFVAAYLGAFRERPRPTPPAEGTTGDSTLMKAFDAQGAGDHIHAFTLVNEAIEQGISSEWKQGQAEALNLRGTYKFLIGDTPGAKTDFERSLELVPGFVQSLVKVASVHMEMGDAAAAFGDFESAIRHNPDDPDIYYHRGQLYFVSQEFDRASADYEKSTSLDDNFVFSHVQHAVAQYKMGQVRESMAAFRKCLKRFPGLSEPLNYYGELLLDQQRFEDAIDKFDGAIEIERKKKPANVLSLVNKALALFQWKQDMAGAEALCKEALEIDSDCDVAIATLAQLCIQQGKIAEAINWFEKSAKLARTEVELTSALTYEHASRAQLQFLQNYPQMAERLGQLAQQV